MSRLLRKRPRVSYYEPEEPPYDEFVFCTECRDYVYEYCSIHGPLLVIPDEKVPAKTGYPDFVPRAALTIPRVFLHLANSDIEGAGIGVFSTLTLPVGVRFGPYRGARIATANDPSYAWQIYDKNHKPSHVIDASDGNASNWMRYVNCSRHISEQNLVAFQYQGQLYYRTIKVIPRFTELLVFYGSEFAAKLGVELRLYSVFPLPCECYECQAQITKKAPVKRDKREARIEDKPKEDNILKKNPVKELQETSIQPQNDLKINATITGSSIAKEQPKKEKTKKKRNCKKIPVKKFQEPLIKASNRFVAPVTIKNTNETDIPHNETNLTAFECDVCNKSFDMKSDLEKHVHTHTLLINGTASQKNNSETKRNSSNQSNCKGYDETGTKEKPYKCNYCDYACSQKGNLTRHERIHTGAKPYKCHYCSSTFSDKSTLIKHERIHTGIKPYKCHYCSSTFSDKSTLIKHERIHTGIKPYKCHYCSSTFSVKSNLTTHERIHSGAKPYKCHYCSSTFSVKSTLVQHERTHTKEKPYTCDICDYRSAQSGPLKRHLMSQHAAAKPCSCNVCSYTCVSRSQLKRHLIRKHNMQA